MIPDPNQTAAPTKALASQRKPQRLLQGEVASSHGGLLLRVDPAKTESLVSEPQAGRFVMRGREMDRWLRADAVEGDDELRRRVSHGVTYARSLRPK